MQPPTKPARETPPVTVPPRAAVRKSAPGMSETAGDPVLRTAALSINYGTFRAVKEVTLDIFPQQVTAIIGPSGCGKSSLLRSFNRMNEFIPGVIIRGKVLYRGEDIYARGVDPVEVRRRIGMVFQKPNPFPKSIFKNVSWGLSINRYQGDIRDRVETAPENAA